ncbi:MAG: SufD family Fe-S cluster assembly protein, partial [Pseudomonadota bacterium]
QHNALLLEDGAVVNAKPELEIYADDVACAHGNTCGALDDEALFYMRARGIPEFAAKALLTEAFIAEALETAYEPAIEILSETARAWLKQAAHRVG